MTVILWLAAVFLGSALGIAFGRLAALLPIAAVAQSVVAACAASIAVPVIVFISTEAPMAVSLRMLPVAVVMSLWDNAISILIFALMIAGLHGALGLSTRLAPRRPILLGILGGLLGAVAVGPAIERLNVAPAPSHVRRRVSQTGVFDLGRSDQSRRGSVITERSESALAHPTRLICPYLIPRGGRMSCSPSLSILLLVSSVVASDDQQSSAAKPSTLVDRAREHGGLNIGGEACGWVNGPPTLESLLKDADVVVHGTVVEVVGRLSDDEQNVWTDYTVQPIDVLLDRTTDSRVAHSSEAAVFTSRGGATSVEG